MPPISNLKNLGTLPVPELQTVLTVYLINLEHSEETNLVYTSHDPISTDALPPAHLRFECSDTHSKRGDVLIWAPAAQQHARFICSYWVFDGTAWTKPNPNLGTMMIHPEHPEYQLVIQSGPFVKWELKSKSNREPSLIVPNSPRVRPDALGTMSTIITDVSAPAQGLYDHTAESGTPDGSAGLCGSNAGSPFSESLAEKLPGFEQTQNAAIDDSRFSNKQVTKSLDPHSSDPLSHRVDREIAVSVPPGRPSQISKSVSTPQEGRASSPAREMTPSSATPMTPKSTKQTFSRTVRTPAAPSASPPPSPLKRPRPRSGEHEYARPASLSSPHLNLEASQTSPFPTSRRRKLDDGSDCPPATRSHGSSAANLKTTAPPDAEDDPDADGEDDSDYIPTGDIAVPAAGNDTVEQKVGQQSTALNSPPDSISTVPLVERIEGNAVEKASQHYSAVSNLQEDLSNTLRQEGESLDTAVHLAQQLHAYIARSAAVLVESKRETELRLKKLQGERDHAFIALDDLKRSEAEARNACQEANELANTHKIELQRLRQSESSLLQARDDLEAQLTSSRSELDMLTKAQQARVESDTKRLEETKGKLKEQRRRADHFEKSLRVAQEALQRQRTLAQEAEARQRGTIAQLAREFQEKDQSAKHLAEEVETMTKRVTELGTTLLASEQALLNEKEIARRAIDELEGAKKTAQDNRDEIARLNTARVEDQFNLSAAEEQVSALNTRVEQLQKEVATREAALSQEVKSRKEYEKQSQELRASTMYFDQLRNIAETHLVQERTARQQAESLLESQLAQFGEYLSLTDRERRRLEHMLLEEGSSLRLDLKTKCRDLESMQAECTKLKAERDSERDRLSAELTSSQQRLEAVLVEHKGLCNQLHSRTQEVKEARHECAVMKSHLSAERDKFEKDRTSLLVQTDHELSVLQECAAESLEARKRAEAECATLNLTAKEQSKALMAMQAGLVSERERLAKEFSISRYHLEAQLEDSRKQIETLRGEHETSVQGFQAQRANFESEVRCAAEALASIQAAAISQKETELQTERAERERYATQLSSVRTSCLHVEEQLISTQQELARVEKKSAKERASFVDERELLVSERASAQGQLLSLQTKLSKVEDHRRQLQASFREQQSDIASKHSTMQKRLEELEGQLLDAEQRRTHLEDLFSDERAVLEQQLRNIRLELDEERAKGTNTTTELSDERQRTQDLSSSRATLEQELASCRSQLTLIEEKGKCAEAEQADLRLQCGTMSAKLETAQEECERLRTDLSSERLRFGAERSMSPDSLRGKVASLEAYLDQERAVVRTLREEQAKDQSSDHWSELSSQLLRSLHEAQDRLRAEERIRQVLEDKLAERARIATAKARHADSLKAPGLSDPV